MILNTTMAVLVMRTTMIVGFAFHRATAIVSASFSSVGQQHCGQREQDSKMSHYSILCKST